MKSDPWIQMGYKEFLYLISCTYQFIMNSESIHLNSYDFSYMNFYISWIHLWILVYQGSRWFILTFTPPPQHAPILHQPGAVWRRFAAALLPLLFGKNPRSHHKGATSSIYAPKKYDEWSVRPMQGFQFSDPLALPCFVSWSLQALIRQLIIWHH